MEPLDITLTGQLNAWAGDNFALDTAMIWISAVGVPVLVLLVAIQWWTRRDRADTRHVLVAAGLSFLLGLAANQAILLFVHRLRPYDAGVTHLIIAQSGDFSFPSDHATAAFAIAAAFLLHGLFGRGVLFLLAAATISVSRVYVGIHYLGDVLGGAATGVAAAMAVGWAYRPNTRLDRFITSIL
jgi:undecaprenyl-diphosphatase